MVSEIGCPFPEGYAPELAADIVVRQIFSLPRRELRAEMDRLDAARKSGKLSAKVAYSLFIVRNLIQRRLEGVGEDEIRERAEGWAEIFVGPGTP